MSKELFVGIKKYFELKHQDQEFKPLKDFAIIDSEVKSLDMNPEMLEFYESRFEFVGFTSDTTEFSEFPNLLILKSK